MPPESVAVITGLRAEERFERHVAVVLVERSVDDGERSGVEIDQLVAANGAGEDDAVAHPASDATRSAAARCEPSPAMTSRGGAGTCAIARDREIDALHAFEPADDQHVVAVRPRAQPIGQRRRMVQALGGDAVERLETRAVLFALVNTRRHSPSIRASSSNSSLRRPTSASVCSKSLYGVPHSS